MECLGLVPDEGQDHELYSEILALIEISKHKPDPRNKFTRTMYRISNCLFGDVLLTILIFEILRNCKFVEISADNKNIFLFIIFSCFSNNLRNKLTITKFKENIVLFLYITKRIEDLSFISADNFADKPGDICFDCHSHSFILPLSAQ